MPRIKVLSTKELKPGVLSRVMPVIDLEQGDFITTTLRTDGETYQQLLNCLETGKYAAFTSARAVEAVHELLLRSSRLPSWKVFALGGRTAETASRLLVPDWMEARASQASELADRIVAEGVDETIFFCGNRRRPELPDRLKAAGIRVQELVVYDTSEAPQAAAGKVDALLFFSPSAVDSFFSVNSLPREAVCFAIGPTTAAALAPYTQNRIVTSTGPSQEEMIETLNHYFSGI